MTRRLILDTGVLVASEPAHAGLADVIAEDDDLVIAAVTVAQLRTGVELASEAYRPARTEFLLRVLRTLPVEPYDLATAEAHGRLLVHAHRSGRRRGAHDLIVAATAVATGRVVLTGDRKDDMHRVPR